jgi:hypothetical protein
MITIGNISGEDVTINSNAIRLRTGKGLNEWLAVIDAWDGNKRKLDPLTSYLQEKHCLDYGWAQVIALYYLCKRL